MEVSTILQTPALFKDCLIDLKVTELSAPLLKFMEFKAQCLLKRSKDFERWNEYSAINYTTPNNDTKDYFQNAQNQTDKPLKSISVQTDKKMFIHTKRVPYNTKNEVKSQMSRTFKIPPNKLVINVEKSTKTIPLEHHRIFPKNSTTFQNPDVKRFPSTMFKKDPKIKSIEPFKSKKKFKIPATIEKLEDILTEHLLDDVVIEVEKVALEEMKNSQENKVDRLKRLRNVLLKIESLPTPKSGEESQQLPKNSISVKCKTIDQTSQTENDTISRNAMDIIYSPFKLESKKIERILSGRDNELKNKTSLYGIKSSTLLNLCEELSTDILNQQMHLVAEELAQITDYITDVCFQEEIELL